MNNHHEDQLFKRVKIGIVIMLAIFAIEIFTHLPQYWPLTRWRMFSGAREMAPTTASLQVQITGAEGDTYTLFPPALGFAADNIIRKSFTDHPEQALYQQLLIQRIEEALPDVTIVEVTGWHNTYSVAYTSLPPFELDQPDRSELLGTLRP